MVKGEGGGNIRVLMEVSLSGVESYGCHGVSISHMASWVF